MLTAFVFCNAPSTDTYIQKTKKSYIDSRARRNLGSINTELQDVQRIMVANIEEVLQRGEALSGKSMISLLSSLCVAPLIFCNIPQIQWLCRILCASFTFLSSLLSTFVLNSCSLSSDFSSLQRLTPRPATCPACQRSTGATPSIWIPAPPMLNWQPVGSFSSCSLSMYASGGSKGGRRKRRYPSGKWAEQSMQTLRKVHLHLRLKKGSLLLIRLCRHATAHFVLACQWMCDLNIDDVIMPSFIINNCTIVR